LTLENRSIAVCRMTLADFPKLKKLPARQKLKLAEDLWSDGAKPLRLRPPALRVIGRSPPTTSGCTGWTPRCLVALLPSAKLEANIVENANAFNGAGHCSFRFLDAGKKSVTFSDQCGTGFRGHGA
jgi:hypothetical protein